ncbi:DUF4349 domain-containing protein [Schaalia suimastitidis]|uniref:DUF4349 domain-containing protein n=1 Tax=Schaalia suimastitidis TaxID=121163 RepID=UPI0004094E54|nr:DUF4349 domain-containing protein [Schaalia suimastitidis]
MSLHRITTRLTLPVLAVALLAGGCSASSPNAMSYEPAVESTVADSTYSVEGAVGDRNAIEAGSATAEASSTVSAQHVIVTGWATVRVDEPAIALTQITTWVEQAGGRIDSSRFYGSGDTTRAEATVRIPAPRYTELTSYLNEVGTVLNQETSREDVGQQVADLEARIAALQTSIDRLTALMNEAANVTDLLEAERELTYRQSELDSLKSQRAYLADQTELSTLTISLTTSSSAIDSDKNVWEGSWTLFVDGISLIGRILVFLAPWAIFGAVIVTPVVMLIRRRRKKGPKDLKGSQAAESANLPAKGAEPAEGAGSIKGAEPANGEGSDTHD